MKHTSQRKILRLDIDLEPLLVLLQRHGYLQKELILSPDEVDSIPTPTVLPDDARLIGASIHPSGLSLSIDVESDSFADAFLGQKQQRRVYLSSEPAASIAATH